MARTKETGDPPWKIKAGSTACNGDRAGCAAALVASPASRPADRRCAPPIARPRRRAPIPAAPRQTAPARESVGMQRTATERTLGNAYPHARTDAAAVRIRHPEGARRRAEQLAEAVATAAPRLPAATATALVDADGRLLSSRQSRSPGIRHHQDLLFASCRRVMSLTAAYHRRSAAVSSRGRNFSATASRARKIRERTVPIGQLIASAISS
jgi:hypothetical protein